MSKLKVFLTTMFIALILILLLVANFFLNRVTPNESTQIGNTAGNLNNKGLYCESNGKVYFSNPYDHNVLYSMNPDETDLKRLNDVGVASINADYKRIYYSQTGSADGSVIQPACTVVIYQVTVPIAIPKILSESLHCVAIICISNTTRWKPVPILM